MEHRTDPVLATVAPISGVTSDVAATVVVHPAGSARRERSRETVVTASANPLVTAPVAMSSAASAVTTHEASAREHLAASSRAGSEDGSLVTEYGLLAIVAATLAGAVISWASNGALVTLFTALLRQARALVGA